MNYRINIMPSAVRDLTGIGDYISLQLYNPEAAAKKLRKIRQSINALAGRPFFQRPLFEYPWLEEQGIYVVFVDNYKILHVPNRQHQTVDIIRVLHHLQDVAHHLPPTQPLTDM